MECELTVIIDNSMSRIGTTLESYDDIGALGKHIRDLALTFITPISSNYRFYHVNPPTSLTD